MYPQNNIETGEVRETPDDQPIDSGERRDVGHEKNEIGAVLSQIEIINREIFDAQSQESATKDRVASLKNELGGRVGGGRAGFETRKIEELEKKKAELIKRRDEWIQENGVDALPAGVPMEDDEGATMRARAESFEEKEEAQKEKLETRKKWFEDWKQDAVDDFEKALRSDWRISEAPNLEATIGLMKLRVPAAMDKKFESYVKGEEKDPPASTVWLHWDTSLLDLLLGNSTPITSLDITFDDTKVSLATKEEIEKGVKEAEKEPEPRSTRQPNLSREERSADETDREAA